MRTLNRVITKVIIVDVLFFWQYIPRYSNINSYNFCKAKYLTIIFTESDVSVSMLTAFLQTVVKHILPMFR